MLSLEGKQLGNYDVTRRIRVGGMGAVYEGRQRTAFDRRVAIKVILGDYASDRDMRRRFAREARTVARLHHPHILPLIEFGDEHGILYLVMPFIDGGTLTSYLRRSLPDLGEVAAIYQQLLDAVEYAHDEGLIHRDIKSSNVLLELRRSGPPYIYLADFGLVRTTRRAELDQTGEHAKVGKQIPLDQVPGTPHYMAPEQTRGIVTPQTDIYALGVLLFQMLTGELPYDDEDEVRVIQMHLHAPIPAPSERDASIPHELDDVVRLALAKRPEERFASVGELRRAFLEAIKGPVATIADPEPPIASSGPTGQSPQGKHKPRTSEALHRNPTELILPEPRRVEARRASGERVTSEALFTSPTESPARREPGEPHEGMRVVPAARPVRTSSRFGKRVRTEGERRAGYAEHGGQANAIRQAGVAKRATGKKSRPRRFGLMVTLVTLIPIVLIALLLVSRLLGFSIFPAGFPLLGASSSATINITPKSQALQNDYVLVASPAISTPDSASRTVPARNLQGNASSSRDVKTTGTQTTQATQAQGYIILTNSTDTSHTVPNQTIITTTTGVQVQTTADITVPRHNNGKDGTNTVAASAVQPGAAGNIPANAISGPCCNSKGISASNPAAFSGGVDARTVAIVNQVDIDGVKSSLAPGLQRQVQQQIQQQIGSGDLQAGQITYTINVTPAQPAGTQADHVTVTINVSGALVVFNHDDVTHMGEQLLGQQATASLDSHYHLQGKLNADAPRITGQGSGGSVDLTVTVHGLWVYALTSQQATTWLQAIRGLTLAAANAYLTTQTGIAHADIHLPFGTDHLPNNSDDITILLGTVSP